MLYHVYGIDNNSQLRLHLDKDFRGGYIVYRSSCLPHLSLRPHQGQDIAHRHQAAPQRGGRRLPWSSYYSSICPIYCLPDHKIPHSSMLKQEGPQGNDSPQLSENQNLLNPESHTWISPILVSTFPLQIYINFLIQLK